MSGASARRTFLSYAWEDGEDGAYRQWVIALATRLRKDGVDVRLDCWHLDGVTIAEFMNREVRELGDEGKILVLCSPQYQRNVHAMENGGKPSGTGWEAMLLGSSLFSGQVRREQLVVGLGRGMWSQAVPSFLWGYTYVDLTERGVGGFESSYQKLLRRLHSVEPRAPELGSRPGDLQTPDVPPARGPATVSSGGLTASDTAGRYAAPPDPEEPVAEPKATLRGHPMTESVSPAAAKFGPATLKGQANILLSSMFVLVIGMFVLVSAGSILPDEWPKKFLTLVSDLIGRATLGATDTDPSTPGESGAFEGKDEPQKPPRVSPQPVARHDQRPGTDTRPHLATPGNSAAQRESPPSVARHGQKTGVDARPRLPAPEDSTAQRGYPLDVQSLTPQLLKETARTDDVKASIPNAPACPELIFRRRGERGFHFECVCGSESVHPVGLGLSRQSAERNVLDQVLPALCGGA